jgi:transcriptional regulator with XRE-family HTH domain
MNQEKIGKFIAKCRKNKKMTQSELAEKLGVTDKSIGNWENGRNMPDLSLFKPLCDELGITINELLSGEKISKDKYQEKFEENIVNTINYSTKKINNYSNVIGLLLVIFGLFISMSAIMIFPSESSWGSIYSVFGIVIFVIGISKLTASR